MNDSGALLPYLISWTLYQGKLLITVLNWAGLLVNGTVAFILPLIFIIRTMDRRENDDKRRNQIHQLQLLGVVRNVKWGTLQLFYSFYFFSCYHIYSHFIRLYYHFLFYIAISFHINVLTCSFLAFLNLFVDRFSYLIAYSFVYSLIHLSIYSFYFPILLLVCLFVYSFIYLFIIYIFLLY